MRNLTSSYLDKTLDPLQRVYRLWYYVFSLSYGRFWLSCDSVYPLANHFITLNAYLCAEINAHALIMLITALREGQKNFYGNEFQGTRVVQDVNQKLTDNNLKTNYII
jgi:hypothetical protein